MGREGARKGAGREPKPKDVVAPVKSPSVPVLMTAAALIVAVASAVVSDESVAIPTVDLARRSFSGL
jgi:hypothetical protein